VRDLVLPTQQLGPCRLVSTRAVMPVLLLQTRPVDDRPPTAALGIEPSRKAMWSCEGRANTSQAVGTLIT
jgi:hypothetical protein